MRAAAKELLLTALRWITLLQAVTAVLLFAFLALDPSGRLPQADIQTLRSPIGVKSWSENGLHLVDGRTIRLPGIAKLPLKSEALREAVSKGVEIKGNGRIVGLVSLRRTCGNDPVVVKVRRIDLGACLSYLSEGESEPSVPLPDPKQVIRYYRGRWPDVGFALFTKYLRDRYEPALGLSNLSKP